LAALICWGWRGEICKSLEQLRAQATDSIPREVHASEWTKKVLEYRLSRVLNMEKSAVDHAALTLEYLDIGPILWLSLDEAGEWGYSVKVLAGFGTPYYLLLNNVGGYIELRKGERLGEVFDYPFYDDFVESFEVYEPNALDIKLAQDQFYMRIKAMKPKDISKFIVCYKTADGIREFSTKDTAQIKSWVRFFQSIEIKMVVQALPDVDAPYSFYYIREEDTWRSLFHGIIPDLGFEYDDRLTLHMEKYDKELLKQLMDEMGVPNAIA